MPDSNPWLLNKNLHCVNEYTESPHKNYCTSMYLVYKTDRYRCICTSIDRLSLCGDKDYFWDSVAIYPLVTGCTVEWFCTFCEVNSKKSANFAARAGQSFPFQKIAGALIINIFLCENLQNPFLYIKEQSPIIKFEIKSCSIFFKNSQKWPKRFLI